MLGITTTYSSPSIWIDGIILHNIVSPVERCYEYE